VGCRWLSERLGRSRPNLAYERWPRVWRHIQTPTALPPWSGQTLFRICFAFLILCIFIFLLFLFILRAKFRRRTSHRFRGDSKLASYTIKIGVTVCSTNQPSRSDKIQYAAIWLASISRFSYDLVIYLVFIFYLFFYFYFYYYLICPCVEHRQHASVCKISPPYVAPFQRR